MEIVKECLLELFTVYHPNQQGIPRKYLIRENSIGVFDHNALKVVKSISSEEREALWFSFRNLLGESFIRQKLSIPIEQPSPQKPSMPANRKTASVMNYSMVSRRQQGTPNKYYNISELENSASPSPRSHRNASQSPDRLTGSFFVIEDETKEVNIDYIRDLTKTMNSFTSSKAAMQNTVQKLTMKYSNRNWNLKTLAVGLLFGSPRVVLTDLHNVYVITGSKTRGGEKTKNKNVYQSPINIERPSVTIEKSSFPSSFTSSFVSGLQGDLKNMPVEAAIEATLHRLPKQHHWEVRHYSPNFAYNKLYVVFSINGVKYLLTQEEPRESLRSRSSNYSVSSFSKYMHSGLPNQGNSSYQNSVIQCLAHSQSVADFLDENYQKNPNMYSGQRSLGRTFKDLLANIRSGNTDYASKNLSVVRYYLGKYSSRWNNGSIQDTREFLEALLSLIDREKPISSIFQGSKICDYNYLCGVNIQQSEDFSFITVQDNRPLQDLVRRMVNEKSKEKLQCPSHGRVEMCHKHFRVQNFPQVLVFVFHGNTFQVNLHSDEFLSAEDVTYRLVGVVFRSPYKQHSHLLSACKVQEIWHTFDDAQVSSMDELEIKSPYLAFYDINI